MRIVIAAVFSLLASAAHADGCSGILTRSQSDLELTESKQEDVCIIHPSEAAKVMRACRIGQYCTIVGKTKLCKDSGECVEVSHISNVRRGRK
jgi:hypothetical protein